MGFREIIGQKPILFTIYHVLFPTTFPSECLNQDVSSMRAFELNASYLARTLWLDNVPTVVQSFPMGIVILGCHKCQEWVYQPYSTTTTRQMTILSDYGEMTGVWSTIAHTLRWCLEGNVTNISLQNMRFRWQGGSFNIFLIFCFLTPLTGEDFPFHSKYFASKTGCDISSSINESRFRKAQPVELNFVACSPEECEVVAVLRSIKALWISWHVEEVSKISIYYIHIYIHSVYSHYSLYIYKLYHISYMYNAFVSYSEQWFIIWEFQVESSIWTHRCYRVLMLTRENHEVFQSKFMIIASQIWVSDRKMAVFPKQDPGRLSKMASFP